MKRALIILTLLFRTSEIALADCQIKSVPLPPPQYLSNDHKGPCPYGRYPNLICKPAPAASEGSHRIVKNSIDLGLAFDSFDAASHYFKQHLQNACPKAGQASCDLKPGLVQWKRYPSPGSGPCPYGRFPNTECKPAPAPILQTATGWHLKQGDRVVVKYMNQKNAETGLSYLIESGYCGNAPTLSGIDPSELKMGLAGLGDKSKNDSLPGVIGDSQKGEVAKSDVFPALASKGPATSTGIPAK